MKKVFVFYVCFCLLFFQSVFGIDENFANNVSSTNSNEQSSSASTKDSEQNTEPEKVTDTELENIQKRNVPENDSQETAQTVTKIEEGKEKITDIQPVTGTRPVTTDNESIENTSHHNPSDLTKSNKKSKDVIKDISDVPDTRPVTAEKINMTSQEDTKSLKKSSQSVSSPTKILITEILLNTSVSSHEEYIELYNITDSDINLNGYELVKYTKSKKCSDNPYKLVKTTDFTGTIRSHDYFVITHKEFIDKSWADLTFPSSSATIATNSAIAIFDNNDILVDKVGFGKAKCFEKNAAKNPSKNQSIERDKENGKYIDTDNNADDFHINPCPFPGKFLPPNLSTNIYINEIYPNPCVDNTCNYHEEFIELYNPDNISLNNWKLTDASSTNKLLDDSTIDSSHTPFIKLTINNFKFILNNSGDSISLISPDCKTVSSISYNNSKKGLSYNYDENWYWEQPTPNAKNIENPLTKEYPKLVINEFLPNPIENEEENEFIELYNPTDTDVSLKDWILHDASKTGEYIFKNTTIQSQGYLVIYRKDFKFALNNNGEETIKLIAPNQKVISSVSYNQTRKGISLNRASEWYFAQMSPRKENYPNPKTLTYPILQLSEILPNPIGQENTDEFIEIYNPNATKINLKYWTLKDASKTGTYTFTKDIFIEPKNYFVIYRRDFKFALNNGTESISLIAPNEKTVSKISYKSAKENVSYNFEQTTKDWRWSKHLTPAKENIFNNLPVIIKFDIDKKVYKNVYAEFSTKARDVDSEELKVRWDFGDGHKSYKWKTRHKYEKTGIYNASLRIQDGSEEITKNFKIVVKKYPKYDVEIIKISPNPSGKDSGTEYITIKNNSNKKINLKNWSIATGTSKKTLVNHPINEKLIINPGKTKNITKKYCALTLPNKTGTIEIRRPSGSVSDKLKYGDKNISIPDNAIYEKINKQWQWNVPKDLEKLKQTQEIIAQALANEQILAQQQLESIVAYNAIHNSKENIDIIKHKQDNLLDNIVKYINLLLNKTILTLHNTQKFHTKKLASQFPLYAPHYQNTNPCEQPTIYNSNKLHFCQN